MFIEYTIEELEAMKVAYKAIITGGQVSEAQGSTMAVSYFKMDLNDLKAAIHDAIKQVGTDEEKEQLLRFKHRAFSFSVRNNNGLS